MPLLKTPDQIAKMRESGRIIARALRLVSAAIEPGVTPKQLNDLAEKCIREEGGVPNFLGYHGFPAAACISVNEVVVHGIPTEQPLQEGDIISLDFGVLKDGWNADAAWTYPVGEISTQAKRLLSVTRESLYQGIAKARPGGFVGDIGAAVQRYVESNGYSVVRDLVGHGIGEALHEEPSNVANYGKPKTGMRLQAGMTICIEPMVNAGRYQVRTLEDDWTVVTADGSLSAHFEHTVAITADGPEILTKED
jgi:methionyl aminopeptidase